MATLTVTPAYAGIFAFLYLYLAFAVIRLRWSERVSIGDNGNARVLRAMRAHGNFSEYVPIALMLMMMAELGGVGTGVLHAIGAPLLAGRVAHGWCFLFAARNVKARVAGMAMTLVSIGIAGGALLWSVVAA